MNVLYGYDDKLMINLLDFIRSTATAEELEKGYKPKNLTGIFRNFSSKEGVSSGTVRNLYYAIAKKSTTDEEFCKKYLQGLTLTTEKADRFSPEAERELLKNILIKKAKTRSVRSAVLSLSNGDGKTALRYQNKYRSALKNSPDLINSISDELTKNNIIPPVNAVTYTSEFGIEKVKDEINRLVGKIADGIRRENAKLKKENEELKIEIERLKLTSGIMKADFFDKTQSAN